MSDMSKHALALVEVCGIYSAHSKEELPEEEPDK